MPVVLDRPRADDLEHAAGESIDRLVAERAHDDQELLATPAHDRC